MSNFIKFNFDAPVLLFREHATNSKLQNIIKVLSSHDNSSLFVFTIFIKRDNSTLTLKSGKFSPYKQHVSEYLFKRNTKTNTLELLPVYNIQMYSSEDESANLLSLTTSKKSTAKPKQLRMKTNIKLSNLLNKNFKQFSEYNNQGDISEQTTVDYKQAFLSAGTINKHSSNYLSSRVEEFKEEDENSQDYTDESESLVEENTESESAGEIESSDEDELFGNNKKDENKEKTATKQIEDISINKKIKMISTNEINESFVVEQIKNDDKMTMKKLVGIVKERYELKENTISQLKGILKKVAKLVKGENEKYLILK